MDKNAATALSGTEIPPTDGGCTPSEEGSSISQDSTFSTTEDAIQKKTRVATKKGATEGDIENAQPSTKLVFGKGFQMLINEKGAKYFQYRYCLDKSSTRNLGTYPEMEYPQALEEAEKVRKEVKLARKKKSMAAFKARLKKPKIKRENNKYSTFQSMEDAGQFLRNLFSNNVLMDEIRFFFTLLILIPARPSELLSARWNDFGRDLPRWAGVEEWTIKPGRMNTSNNKQMRPQIAYLSQNSKIYLNEIRQIHLQGNGDGLSPLFPRLFGMPKAIRDREISQAMRNIWPNYPIEPEGFRFFFKAMAYENSYFKPELIDEMMEHTAGNKIDDTNRSFIQFMHAIADWWGNELGWHSVEKIPHQAGRYQNSPSAPSSFSPQSIRQSPSGLGTTDTTSTKTSEHGEQAEPSNVELEATTSDFELTPLLAETYPEVAHSGQQPPAITKSLTRSYTKNDVNRWYNWMTVLKARGYQNSIENMDIQPDKITAQVIEDATHPYHVEIMFTTIMHGELSINPTCTCLLKKQCKHTAAVLLSALSTMSEPV